MSQTNPWPEYPRPQLTRSDWQSLNGQWQFAAATSIETPPVGQNLAEQVLVPFPIESALSGLMRHQDYMWYRRTFQVPSSWSDRHVQLNFGAVNWQAKVWVNGQLIGSHSGGYDPFSLDITSALISGDNELIVGVYSPVDSAGAPIPLGKQRLQPEGIWYTASSGIWQTVWLEPTNAAHITRFDTTPDLPGGALNLMVQGAGISGQGVEAVVYSNGNQVTSATGTVGSPIQLAIPNARLWSPDDPFLYDLTVSLTGSGGGDSVGGYFGMRSIGKAMVRGVLRPVLNGNFVFQLGTLDQGFWPDGIYTAPTDEALRFDLEQQKNLGFNTVRKHVKIEPARWYYWTDKLGLLVWQDMPSLPSKPAAGSQAAQNFESELFRMIDQLRAITSIVQWEPFNEDWGAYDIAGVTDLVKSWDPTRLVDGNSGVGFGDGGNGDVIDVHNYTGPGEITPPTDSRVAVLGEFGGWGLAVSGHEWQPGQGGSYVMLPDADTLTRRYVETTGTVQRLIHAYGLSGSIYTQPTDVENEVNGLWTYDRQVLKLNADQARAVNLAVRNSVADLRQGELVSLQATADGYTNRYVRHQNGLGVASTVSESSNDLTRLDSTFWVRPGLADSTCYSFESRNYAGHFLRHSGYRIRKDANDGSTLFAQDSTFCAKSGLSGVGFSFESYNYPSRFLRRYNTTLYIAASGGPNPWDTPNSYVADVSWRVVDPWWRSGVSLPVDTARSLQVVTAGYTDRYLRHEDNLGTTEVVTASSSDLLKQEATFYIRHGLADPSCYSFESRNYSGHYLRHSGFRIRKDPNDGSALFKADATFCAQLGLNGSDVSFASYNIAGMFIRHKNAEVWIGVGDGLNAGDGNPGVFAADATWHIADAWAP